MSELIRWLSFRIGLDPAGIPVLDKKDYLQSGDAQYVQTIHMTSLAGTTYNIADDDIYIKVKVEKFIDEKQNWFKRKFDKYILSSSIKHELAMKIFLAICTRQIYLIAGRKGINGGLVLTSYPKNPEDLPKPDTNQILVGMPRTPKLKQDQKETKKIQENNVFEVNFAGNEVELKKIMDSL